MSRSPRDPMDPFNDRNGPFGGFGPFGNDPFFKQFEQIHERIFRDFFGGDDIPSIFIEHPGFGGGHSSDDRHSSSGPDLSAINPDAPSSKLPSKRQDSRSNYHGAPSLFRMFEHFFEPELDDRRLSDINPNLSNDGPIMTDDADNKGLIHPNGPPAGFRSPYLPNRNGAEKRMEFGNEEPQTFFRSQSVVISTDSNGKTTKTTTIRDSNGQSTTTTEEVDNGHSDGNGNGFGNGFPFGDHSGNDKMPSIFNWGFRGNDVESNGQDDTFWNDGNGDRENNRFKIVPMLEQTNDPFASFRKRWENWKYNPYNLWSGKSAEMPRNPRQQCDLGNRNGNERREGIRWTPYREYRSDVGKGTKRRDPLDDIVKKD